MRNRAEKKLQTDRRTDGPTDKLTPMYPPNRVLGGIITLNKISWFMPHVLTADKEKMELYKIIEKKEKLPVGYRMTQCDSIAVPQSTSFT